MSKRLVSTKHPDFERMEFNHEAGPVIRTMIEGEVHPAFLCRSVALSAHTVNGVEFGCLAMAMPNEATALYQPFDADGLRSVAAAMMRVADHLDGGAGKQ